MTTTSTAKPRAPHRHGAQQRRHPTKPPVLDVTRLTARSPIRTQNRVIVGLDGDGRLLQARQDLLRRSQRQPQLRDPAEASKWPDTQYIDDPCRTIDLGFNQAQDPPNPRTPSQKPVGKSYHLRPYPPHSGHARSLLVLANDSCFRLAADPKLISHLADLAACKIYLEHVL
jgi:hypothetical protein